MNVLNGALFIFILAALGCATSIKDRNGNHVGENIYQSKYTVASQISAGIEAELNSRFSGKSFYFANLSQCSSMTGADLARAYELEQLHSVSKNPIDRMESLKKINAESDGMNKRSTELQKSIPAFKAVKIENFKVQVKDYSIKEQRTGTQSEYDFEWNGEATINVGYAYEGSIYYLSAFIKNMKAQKDGDYSNLFFNSDPEKAEQVQCLSEFDPVKKFNLTKSEQASIAVGEGKIGMRDVVFMLSKGKPQKVNTTVTGKMIHQQYVYRGNLFVYVENGKVSSFQKF